MKTTYLEKLKFLITASAVLVLGTPKGHAQLHETNGCANNFSLNWTTAPNSQDEFDWTPEGSLTNTFTNVDGSGVDMTITFSGDTYALEDWNFRGGPDTPHVGGQAVNGLSEVLNLFTSGYSNQGITMTITFSEPIFGLGFDIHHVNAGGQNGDKYTITATNTLGDTVYPIFTESNTPSYTTNNRGVVNAFAPSTSGDNASVGLNFYDDNYINSITLLWQDCDTCTPGFVHGSGLGKISFCTPQSLGFDGVDDYISAPAFLGGEEEATMMAWIKIDNASNGPSDIMGQRNFRLFLNGDDKLRAYVRTDAPAANNVSIAADMAPTLEKNLWYHVATVYDGNSLKLYINGELLNEERAILGGNIRNGRNWNENHGFSIGRNSFNENDYFHGAISEARVYNVALNEDQLRKQIYQKIEENDGVVKGSVIKNEITGLSWDRLRLYFEMDNVDDRLATTTDASANAIDGILHNMKERQENNQPTPYIAYKSGNWMDENVWLHGDVWDIDNTPHKDWAIVKIINEAKLSSVASHTHLGLLLEEGTKLTILNDQELQNTAYLNLDGVIRLRGESQLIQTAESILDPNSKGSVERSQQGTADSFTYNYWSSPVGAINDVENNKAVSINQILKDGSDVTNLKDINFRSSHTAADNGATNPITISDYWIFTFRGAADDINAFTQVRSTTAIGPGAGYTMKGSGAGTVGQEQNYVFVGKPNNGEISLDFSAGEQYLVGNPYPSALDADQFIRDNISLANGGNNTTNVIDGTLYFWEHFGGGTHVLRDYQGGYATYNLSGGVSAISHPDVSQTGTGSKEPSPFISVAQGFFVTAADGGAIKFNNNQRTFKRETDGASVFFRNDENATQSDAMDSRFKLKLNITSTNGISRELLVTEDEHSTYGKDVAYDAQNQDFVYDDASWIIEEENFIIQGIPLIDESTELPLTIKARNAGLVTIALGDLQNRPEGLEVFLYDSTTEERFNLEDGVLRLDLPSGTFKHRFKLVFSRQQVLSIEEEQLSEETIKIATSENRLMIIANAISNSLNNATLYNMLGQELKSVKLSDGKAVIATNGLAGMHIVKVETANGMFSKKVVLR
ncbi:LamG-like jellyroll fold domain-containing protein [Sungkyunkwania multivorans]|uniref:LamG-like jellyroll fold domain-containing protein n=1 Tax=Sungkyunkwania multivorans TaxID=1173618 RepID=A0ABW3CV21_9FLAO